MLTLTQVVKKYRIGDVETTVLNRVSLHIKQGEMLAIVGASGSGKSTLLNILGLLDTPDEGEYCLQGRAVHHLHSDELALLRNRQFGFVFQQFNLLPRFSAMHNVALPLTYRSLSPQAIEEKVKDVLARVGMSAFKSRRPTELSGGQQQRIAIARALVGDPTLILADEPTGALDSKTGKEIMSLFLSLHGEGRTLVLVTHDEQVALQCERRISMADGHIL